MKILLPLASDWKTIGILLNLKIDILEKIQNEERKENNRLLVMLSQWTKHQIEPPPTWEILSNAVKTVNPLIAKLIRDKHPDEHEVFPGL